MGSAETVGKAKRIFCCPRGVWAGLCGVQETCNGPGTRAPCHLVTSRFPRPLAREVSGFVCSNECPGAVSSRSGAAPPPSALSLAAAPSQAVRTAPVAAASFPSSQIGLLPAAPSSRSYEVALWKGGSREVEGGKTWQEMAQFLLPRPGLCPSPRFWSSELLLAAT